MFIRIKKERKSSMKKIIFLALMIGVITGCGNTNSSLNENGGETVNEGNNHGSVSEDVDVDTITIHQGETEEIVGMYRDDEIKAEITLNDVFYTDEITPPQPTQSFYSYYAAEEGSVYEVIDITIKNTGTEYFSDYVLRGFLSDTCTPTFTFDGGYTYTGISTTEISRDSDGEYDLDYFNGIDPLETKHLYLFTEVSSEIKDSSLTINICFGDNPLQLNW